MLNGILFGLATAPVLVILIVVYFRDKVEKEPVGLLLKLLLFGALSFIPIYIGEVIMDYVVYFLFGSGNIVSLAVSAFIGVALVEEGFKYLALRLVTWKNKNFNFFYDGIIYAVTASLGFALLENLIYVFIYYYGADTAIQRAFTAVPAHAAFGIAMGLFYAGARYRKNFGMNSESTTYTVLSLLVPVLMHGFYDFCLFTEIALLYYVAMAFAFIMDVVGIVILLKYSKSDRFILSMRPEQAIPTPNGYAGNVPNYGGQASQPIAGNVPNYGAPMSQPIAGNVPNYGAPMSQPMAGNVPPMQPGFVPGANAYGQPQGKVPPMPPQNGQNVQGVNQGYNPNFQNNNPNGNGGGF